MATISDQINRFSKTGDCGNYLGAVPHILDMLTESVRLMGWDTDSQDDGRVYDLYDIYCRWCVPYNYITGEKREPVVKMSRGNSAGLGNWIGRDLTAEQVVSLYRSGHRAHSK